MFQILRLKAGLHGIRAFSVHDGSLSAEISIKSGAYVRQSTPPKDLGQLPADTLKITEDGTEIPILGWCEVLDKGLVVVYGAGGDKVDNPDQVLDQLDNLYKEADRRWDSLDSQPYFRAQQEAVEQEMAAIDRQRNELRWAANKNT